MISRSILSLRRKGQRSTLVYQLQGSVEMTLHRRRLFVTDQGWMGLARSDVAEGDAIFILAGGPTPFILKPTSSGYAGGKVGMESPPGQLYTLLSDCYIHGIMD